MKRTKLNPLRSEKSGSTLTTAMIFMTVIGTMVASALTVTSSTDAMIFRGTMKQQATELAESGINRLYDQIRLDFLNSKSITTSIPITPVTTLMGSSTAGAPSSQGTYQAQVISSSVNSVDTVTADPSTGKSVPSTIFTYSYLVQGTGVSKGVTSIERASFTGTITNAKVGSQSGGYGFGSGVIQANAKVSMLTSASIRTYDTYETSPQAHIIANQGMSWDTPSSTKATVTSPNMIMLQGQLLVPNQPTSAPYYYSTGFTGMGNPNGSTNYQTSATSGSPTNSISPMTSARSFPAPTTVDSWNTNWLAISNSPLAQTFNSSVTSTAILPRSSDQWRVLQAPAVINGNLTINSGDALRFMPSSDPTKNIVYVKGSVKNMGQLLNLGVTIVMTGSYTDTSSSEYRIDAQGSPFVQSADRLTNAALISLQTSSAAINVSSNITSTYGFVYAAKGGVRIMGNLDMMDTMIVAGGDAKTGAVTVAPAGGGSYSAYYNPIHGSPKPMLTDGGTSTFVPNATILVPYQPSTITGWSLVSQ